MKKEIINSKNAPTALGPYSQAVRANGFLFVSGQLGLDPKTGNYAGEDIESQCHQVFANLESILTEAGMTFDNVVKATVYLADISDFSRVNKVYGEYFQPPYPARVAFAVQSLPNNALVEIEVIAAE